MFTRWSVYMKGRKMCRSLASFGSGEEMKLHFTINKGKDGQYNKNNDSAGRGVD